MSRISSQLSERMVNQHKLLTGSQEPSLEMPKPEGGRWDWESNGKNAGNSGKIDDGELLGCEAKTAHDKLVFWTCLFWHQILRKLSRAVFLKVCSIEQPFYGIILVLYRSRVPSIEEFSHVLTTQHLNPVLMWRNSTFQECQQEVEPLLWLNLNTRHSLSHLSSHLYPPLRSGMDMWSIRSASPSLAWGPMMQGSGRSAAIETTRGFQG